MVILVLLQLMYKLFLWSYSSSFCVIHRFVVFQCEFPPRVHVEFAMLEDPLLHKIIQSDITNVFFVDDLDFEMVDGWYRRW